MSVVVIEVENGVGGGMVDITNSVIYESASFQSQLSAIPGTCEFTVRDIDRSLEFIIGSEISMSIDGIKMWGGYLMEISATFAFEADDTSHLGDDADFHNRLWSLHGVDFNILFDKRVLRNPDQYRSRIPNLSGAVYDGDAIRQMFTDYVDVPAGFDVTTYVDNVTTLKVDGLGKWPWMTQGTIIREQLDKMSLFSGASYYIDADKNVHYHAIETLESRWGFSDVPNNVPLTSTPLSYQSSTWGFREVEATEDGSTIVNDALIWGGSEWNNNGSIAFARSQDATSQADHGRWQVAEVHVGEDGFTIQSQVDARADVIINGPPGATSGGLLKGQKYTQWTYRFAWHDKDVPTISGVPIHLTAGQLITVELQVFGVTKLLPLRTMTISFPAGNPTTLESYVRFEADLGIQISDPFTLWAVLLRRESKIVGPITAVNNDSTQTVPGALGQFILEPDPDGVITTFSAPFGYIINTTIVLIDDSQQVRNIDYTESDPAAGQIQFVDPPNTGEVIHMICRTA